MFNKWARVQEQAQPKSKQTIKHDAQLTQITNAYGGIEESFLCCSPELLSQVNNLRERDKKRLLHVTSMPP